jgi:tight adherence protein C
MASYLWISIGLSGFAAAVSAIMLTIIGGRKEHDLVEETRRGILRKRSATYRWFEPIVDVIAGVYREYTAKTLDRLQHHLEVVDESIWKADELMAIKQVEGVAVGLVAGLASSLVLGPISIGFGFFMVIVFPQLTAWSYKSKAEKRVADVRARLPFAMDLMALLLEAGAGTLRECFERVGDEHRGQPLGDEVHRTLSGVEKGANTADMLRAMDHRLADSDVKEVVQAIITAEDRGIALKDALRGVADRMRLRKVQWMEKSAEQAKVKITGPAMVSMLACLLIVVAPLLLQAFTAANTK